MEQIKYCTSCRKEHNLEDFIGLKGQECKICATCRQKVSARDKLASTKERKNELRSQNNKAALYSRQYREKQKIENPKKYYENAAKQLIKWRRNWRQKNKNYKISTTVANVKQSASQRNLQCLLLDDEIIKMLQSNCFYCNDNSANGIDRMDHLTCYTTNNCVSCCKSCNMTKTCLDAITFVQRCKHIASQHFPNEVKFNSSYLEAWPINEVIPRYNIYKYRASKKDLTFDISPEDFLKISSQPCFYCKQESINGCGLDRIDNTVGYTATNIVSCCSECNYMKGSKLQDDFLQLCKNVAFNCNLEKIPEQTRTYYCINTKK